MPNICSMKTKITVSEKLKMYAIVFEACAYYNIDTGDLMTGNRLRTYCEARQICIYVAVKNEIAPGVIADFFAKDHSIVNKSVKKINALLSINDKTVMLAIISITKKINT